MAEASREKVHSIQDFKKNDQPHDDIEELKRKGDRDMGKVAILISIMSVLLLVVFFFGLNQNITGLSEEVQTLGGLREEVGALSTQIGDVQQAVGGLQENVGAMESRVAELEQLPTQTRNMIIMNDLSAMSQRLGYIGSQIGDEQQTARLREAQQLLQQLQNDMAQ